MSFKQLRPAPPAESGLGRFLLTEPSSGPHWLMSQVAKLKKQAAEFEAKKQFDKAIGVYIKLLEGFDANPAELDIGCSIASAIC